MTTTDYDGGDTKGHPPQKQDAMKMIMDNASKLLPAVIKVIDGIEMGVSLAVPYVNQGIEVYDKFYKKLEPYGPDEIMTSVTGILLIFFGGGFSTTTAVYEAIHQAGLDKFKKTLSGLFVEYKKFKEENSDDDKEDLDGDGIADVKQITGSQFVARKSLLFLKSTNPEAISAALQQLYAIFIAVLATLRLRFARTISLGAAIGDQISQVYMKFAQPQLELLIDDEYHKWLGPVGNYVAKFIGVMVAFRIQVILTTVHTSVKGGRMLSKGLTALAERNGYSHLTDGYLDEALSGILAVMGIIIQIFMWNSVPVIVRLVLFPLFFVEGLLNIFVSIGMSVTAAPVA